MLQRFWPFMLIIPLVGLLVGLGIASVMNRNMPMRYESFATIEIRPMTMPPDMASEKQRLSAPGVLDCVSRKLDLPTRWDVDADATQRRLRRIIKVTQIKGTDLLQVHARHINPEETLEIIQTLLDCHAEESREIWEKSDGYQRRIQLREAISKQAEIVKQLKLNLDGIPYHIPDQMAESRESTREALAMENKTLMEMHLEYYSLPGWQGDTPYTGSVIHDDPLLDDTPEPAVSPILASAIGLHAGFPVALALMWLFHRRSTAYPLPSAHEF